MPLRTKPSCQCLWSRRPLKQLPITELSVLYFADSLLESFSTNRFHHREAPSCHLFSVLRDAVLPPALALMLFLYCREKA